MLDLKTNELKYETVQSKFIMFLTHSWLMNLSCFEKEKKLSYIYASSIVRYSREHQTSPVTRKYENIRREGGGGGVDVMFLFFIYGPLMAGFSLVLCIPFGR